MAVLAPKSNWIQLLLLAELSQRVVPLPSMAAMAVLAPDSVSAVAATGLTSTPGLLRLTPLGNCCAGGGACTGPEPGVGSTTGVGVITGSSVGSGTWGVGTCATGEGVVGPAGALALLPNLLRGMSWNVERLAKAFDDGMYATDKAVELAVAGLPFREAYKQAAAEPLPKAGADAQASLDARVSPGGAGELQLAVLKNRLQAIPTSS